MLRPRYHPDRTPLWRTSQSPDIFTRIPYAALWLHTVQWMRHECRTVNWSLVPSVESIMLCSLLETRLLMLGFSHCLRITTMAILHLDFYPINRGKDLQATVF
ncbi:unnamed protein product [Somion occarium]|uniref:Uncharacterized protein n=1 Tax=Somion occarium TaxID=3059160 RepID=A0ABP1DC59_9APHY